MTQHREICPDCNAVVAQGASPAMPVLCETCKANRRFDRAYHVTQFARDRWHVIGPSGLPVYDNAPYGNDKPLIFRDEDEALNYAERCNAEVEV